MGIFKVFVNYGSFVLLLTVLINVEDWCEEETDKLLDIVNELGDLSYDEQTVARVTNTLSSRDVIRSKEQVTHRLSQLGLIQPTQPTAQKQPKVR